MPIDSKQTPKSKSSSSSSSIGTNGGTMSSSTTPKTENWFKKKTQTAFKKVNRFDEKIKQAIGTASRTEDDQFSNHLIKFEQQTLAANLIQKELQTEFCGPIQRSQSRKASILQILVSIL